VADPILAINGTDTGATRVVKHNENTRRRFTPDVRTVADAAATQTSTDEMLTVSAVTAARTLTLLPAATANAIYLHVTAADATNTYTVDANAAELIDGSATLVLSAAAKLLLIPDGTGWTAWTF